VIGQEAIDGDLLVAAGDSIFGEGGLDDFARLGLTKNAPVTAVIDVGDLEAVKRYSAITTDGEGRITAFEEKPDQPETTLAGIALYFYPRSVLPLISRYLAEGNNPDQPGRDGGTTSARPRRWSRPTASFHRADTDVRAVAA